MTLVKAIFIPLLDKGSAIIVASFIQLASAK